MHGVLCKFSLSTSLSGGMEWQIYPHLAQMPREFVRQGEYDPSNKVSARQIGFVSSGSRHLGRKLDWGDPKLPRGVWCVCVLFGSRAN